MDTLLYLVGFGILFFFLFGSDTLLSIYREKQRMQHIEKIISSLPEDERVTFAKDYLAEQMAQLTKNTTPLF